MLKVLQNSSLQLEQVQLQVSVLVPARIHLLSQNIRTQEQMARIGNLILRHMRLLTELVGARVKLEVASQISELKVSCSKYITYLYARQWSTAEGNSEVRSNEIDVIDG